MHEMDMKRINNVRQSPKKKTVSGTPRHRQEANITTDLRGQHGKKDFPVTRKAYNLTS
jgi:hypothetical protein